MTTNSVSFLRLICTASGGAGRYALKNDLNREIMENQKTIDGICLSCFEPVAWFVSESRVLFNCSNCGSEINTEEMQSLLDIVENAVKHGYLYPRIETLRPSTEKFDLAIAPVLIWMGLAALGGIVGGISYDIIKVAFQRITKKNDKVEIYCKGKTDFEKKKITIGLQLVATLDLTDDELRCFTSKVEEYVKGSKQLKAIKKHRLSKKIGERILPNDD